MIYWSIIQYEPGLLLARIIICFTCFRSFELKAKTQKGRAFWAFYPFLLAIV